MAGKLAPRKPRAQHRYARLRTSDDVRVFVPTVSRRRRPVVVFVAVGRHYQTVAVVHHSLFAADEQYAHDAVVVVTVTRVRLTPTAAIRCPLRKFRTVLFSYSADNNVDGSCSCTTPSTESHRLCRHDRLIMCVYTYGCYLIVICNAIVDNPFL